MPEYLAPGVFVEEVSYRSKSIEGVSTTTTGFVGPARYGPIENEPDVITNLTEFERVYGDGRQLKFGDTVLHNYLWHGVRAFFEEGGKRLYVARVFSPSINPDEKGYVRPSEKIAADTAQIAPGIGYGTDGHARLWITKATVAVTVAERAVARLVADVNELSEHIDIASADADAEAKKDLSDIDDSLPMLRAKQLVALLGDTTVDKETALAKVMEITKDKVEKAKCQISVTDVKNKLDKVRDTADTASFSINELDKAKVIVPAANGLKEATGSGMGMLKKLEELKQKASAITNLSAPNTIKVAADTLQKKCEAAAPPTVGGDIWKAFNTADAEAKESEDAAASLDDGTPNSTDRATVSGKAKDALIEISKLPEKTNEILRDVGAMLALAATGVPDNVKSALDELSKAAKALEEATKSALLAAQRNAYPRAFAINTLLGKREELMVEIGKLQKSTTNSINEMLKNPGDRTGATLLRARFPGMAGNIGINIKARIGQNVLVADADDSTKAHLRGILPNDLVFISQFDTPSNEANKLYVAYQTDDKSDWYFSADGTQGGAKYSLDNVAGTKLDPSIHEVAIVTCEAEFPVPNGTHTISGLALHPGHTRSGAADSFSSKFEHNPKNGNDARTLPFEVLLDDSIKNGNQVFSALLKMELDDVIEKSAWPIRAIHILSGGNDGVRPGSLEYAGRGEGPDAPKTGLKALEDVEDISIVAAPGATFGYMNGYQPEARQIIGKLISHAENMKYRIAVLESGDDQSIGDVKAMRARYDSKHAALYYPWVRVLDPITRNEIHLPPSGFVAGIYARNDIDRAVYKAPANEVVRGAIGFETLLNKAQQEVLNPEGVNCFRFFEGRGFRLWGARTISSDPEWKYVNVRRYFAYLERSIDRGTQWAVFEPNGEALWANVRETISDFLYNEWKNGALLGSDPKSAYFVRCDRSTMTQNDLDNGRLICKIGVAALKPAEFVIFQIGQWTADRKA